MDHCLHAYIHTSNIHTRLSVIEHSGPPGIYKMDRISVSSEVVSPLSVYLSTYHVVCHSAYRALYLSNSYIYYFPSPLGEKSQNSKSKIESSERERKGGGGRVEWICFIDEKMKEMMKKKKIHTNGKRVLYESKEIERGFLAFEILALALALALAYVSLLDFFYFYFLLLLLLV